MIAATSHVSFGVGNPSRARLVQLEAPPQLINIHSRLTYQLFARFLSFGIELNQIFPPKKTAIHQHNFPYIYHTFNVPPFPIFSPSVKTTVTPLQRTPPVPRALEDGDNASAASSGASGSRSSTRQLSGAQSHGSTERDRLASASVRLQRRMGRCGCSGAHG